MRRALIGLLLTFATALPAAAQLSVSIGLNVPAYPTLVRIPNYPVYYATGVNANYFFYDGLYWVFDGTTWFESPWYNGPWSAVDPFDVPVFLLRVPVRYYHVRPAYFHGWAYDAPPRWGEHWGRSWESRHAGWDHWNRSSAPAAAPLPTYQRSYSGNRYPATVAQQAAIQTRNNYSYQPHEHVSQQRLQAQRTQAQAAPQQAPAVAATRPSEQYHQRAQQAQVQQQERAQQAQQREHAQQQAQAQRQERAQQQRAQQAQAQRQERVQQAQAQRQEHQQAQPQRAQPQPQTQHENRGNDNRGHEQGGEKGRDKHENS